MQKDCSWWLSGRKIVGFLFHNDSLMKNIVTKWSEIVESYRTLIENEDHTLQGDSLALALLYASPRASQIVERQFKACVSLPV